MLGKRKSGSNGPGGIGSGSGGKGGKRGRRKKKETASALFDREFLAHLREHPPEPVAPIEGRAACDIASNESPLSDVFYALNLCPAANERDKRIYMIESSHTYHLDEEPLRGSTTGTIGQWFHKFDPVAVVTDMLQRSCKKAGVSKFTDPRFKWSNPKYNVREEGKLVPMTPQEIVASWQGSNASELGTQMHRMIELFLNGALSEEDLRTRPDCLEFSVELGQFLEFYAGLKRKGWTCVRTEWIIWNDDAQLPGSIDGLFMDADGNFHMMDWKRSAKVNDDNFGKFGSGPCSCLKDSHVSKYMLQQVLYSITLQKYYGITIKSMNLGVFHPDLPKFQHTVLKPNWRCGAGVYERRLLDLYWGRGQCKN